VFLPDGIHFVYSVVSLRDDRRGIYLGSVDGPPARATQLFTSESGAVYAAPGGGRDGMLLSVGNRRIDVRPFDPAQRVLQGTPRMIGIDGIATTPHDAALLSASPNVLAYIAAMIPWGSRFASIAVTERICSTCRSTS
jgi:hypothetical protein